MSEKRQPKSLADITDIHKEPRNSDNNIQGKSTSRSRRSGAARATVQLNVRVSVDTYDRVVRLADECDCSMVEIIEKAVDILANA